MFTFNGYKHQGHSICSRKPPSKFVIGAFFRLICRFRSFFLFISIILKTVGKCSLLTVISIKDFRFAVENHPQNLISDHCWEMFTFNGYKHQGHSICSRKPPSKFVIGSFFRLSNIDLVGFGLCKDLPFSVIFFLFIYYFGKLLEMFTFNGYKHQGHSICSRKPPSKFVIGAFFRLVMLYKETKKKNFRNL
ncbi:hypothetical protein AGLY_017876 [Aphis glycines]|uniref:Uncharacterized protein n=1 Tax=Aphis glycines TaxID=307491 RepID=A0A6G0STM0_APHGL|nr:hypothetical protein AGLY_017876 [Aphis glycines]